MATVMKLMPVLLDELIEGVEPPPWRYLKFVDFDALGGRGLVDLTSNINEAKRFKDIFEAMEFWKQRSKITPTRPDGRPNRPLTAFHATFEEVTI